MAARTRARSTPPALTGPVPRTPLRDRPAPSTHIVPFASHPVRAGEPACPRPAHGPRCGWPVAPRRRGLPSSPRPRSREGDSRMSSRYAEVHARSLSDPESFWAEAARVGRPQAPRLRHPPARPRVRARCRACRRRSTDRSRTSSSGGQPAHEAVVESRNRRVSERLERRGTYRHFIREKGYQCEACGWAIEEDEVDVWGSSFELHHLTPIHDIEERIDRDD